MNSLEVDEAASINAGHETLGPAARYLQAYRDLIDEVSDGWPYWTFGTKRAGKLCEILSAAARARFSPGYVPPSIAEVKAAIRPIQRFMKTHKAFAGKDPIPFPVTEAYEEDRIVEHVNERFPFISKDEARELLRRGGAPKDIVEAHQAKVALDNEPAAPKSFATYVLLKGEKPACNALRFATYHEAEGYGNELLSRWLVPTGFEVRETSDPVNYRFNFTNWSAERIEAAV